MGAEFLIVIRRNGRLTVYPPNRADLDGSLTIAQAVRELTDAGWSIYRSPHLVGDYEEVVLERRGTDVIDATDAAEAPRRVSGE